MGEAKLALSPRLLTRGDGVSSKYFLFFLFFLSGLSGLIYESIWTHYLKLFLGHAAYAQTLVLAIFMGGMAVGAWICGRTSSKWRNLLVGYAVVEGLIGIGALVFHDLFVWVLDLSFGTVIPAANGSATIQLYKWTVASLLILPPSILLGMTFPLMTGGAIRLFPGERGGTIAMLYFTNSLGGAIGVLLSGFILIRLFGLNGTLTAAGLLNLCLASIVWISFRKRAIPVAETSVNPGYGKPVKEFRLMMAVAMLTGLASFIYEIAWIRMLSFVLGTSTHAFELMLSAFILGLAIGGFWIRRRIDHLSDPIRFLAIIQIVMGLAVLATLPLYGESFRLMEWTLSLVDRDPTGYLTFNIVSHGIAMAIMLPAAICAGTTLPLITHILLSREAGEKSIGYVYGINTLGAITGIILVVHVGIPVFGLKGSLIAGSAIDIGLGFLIVRRHWAEISVWLRRSAFPLGVGSLLSAALFVELSQDKMASGVYRFGELLKEDSRVVSYRDGKTATISVTENNQVLALRTNGKPDASIFMGEAEAPTFDEVTMTLIGAIPMLMRPDSLKVANIGFGSGLTSHTVLANPSVKRLDNIEIESAVIDAARIFYPYNARAYTDPRSYMHVEDAKTFFSTVNDKYDVIISEPSNPWVSGVAGLFSVEFYRNIKRHLRRDGIVAQWLQLYEIDMNTLGSILKALSFQFRNFEIYAVNHGDLLIIASDNEIGEFEAESAFSVPELTADLARIGVHRTEDLRVRWIGDRDFLEPILSLLDVPANSDYAPYVDQHAAMERFISQSAPDVLFPIVNVLPIRNFLAGWELGGSETTITPSPQFLYSAKPYAATYLRDKLAGQLAEEPSYFPELQEEIARIDRFFSDCQILPQHGDKVYVAFQLVATSLVYLNPQELEALWGSLENMACGNMTKEHERRWINLFKNIGRRAATDIMADVEWLLERRHLLSETRGAYLVGIGMLSLIAQDHPDDARLFWEKYAKEWIGPSDIELHYRYLLAKAELGSDN